MDGELVELIGGALMGFRFDTRHLPQQTQAIIAARDANDKRSKEERMSIHQESKKSIYVEAIFMKLGTDITGKYNGMDTLDIYQGTVRAKGYTWFSTNSLSKGMAEKKRIEFLKAVESKSIVHIYFAVGKKTDKLNDIVFMAEVKDIKTDAEGISSPEIDVTPEEWKGIKSKIWIKISKLEQVSDVTARDFVVVSSGKVLADVISKSQYQYGYIKRLVN